MKIGIDISQVVYETGVSTYTRNLVKNLLLIDKKDEYILFGGSLRRLADLKLQVKNFRGGFLSRLYPLPPSLADILWNRLHVLPIERLTGDLDVFHSSDWTQPPSKAFKVTTIHDLVPVLYPSLAAKDVIRDVAKTHRRRLSWVKKEADRIIVPSNTTMNDLLGLGFKKEKIRVIPEAPDPIFKPANKSEIDKLKRKYNIVGNYLLAIGVNPRKNTEKIIEAFNELKEGGSLELVIVGHQYMSIKATVGVTMLGHVRSEERPVLYSGAEALVYPSLYEGFGLPILEAFACKTPVVTSNMGSMVEVAGKAAVLVDPNSVDSIAEGIKKAVNESEKWVGNGVKRVKGYSWLKTAKETLKVYKEVKE